MMCDSADADLTDADLWADFVAATLTRDKWTHRAHVRIGYLHVRGFPFPEALELVRTRIQALNQFHGAPEALDRGYHETMTRAFLQLIAAAATHSQAVDSEQFCEQHPALLRKRILMEYYSRNCIMTWEAKAEFVAPDLRPLPIIGNS